MVTIILADDHHVVRLGLRALIEAEPDFTVIAEAEDGLAADRLVEQHQPDILVVDLMMPGINGLEVARRIERSVPQTRVIVLSMHADESYVLEALRCGVVAYVLKDSPGNELVHAIREVLAGRHYLSPPLSERAITSYARQANEAPLDPYETLTRREREILHLAAQGLSAGDIAQRLSISPRTAETHRANLMRKLNLRSQADLIRYAIRRGLIPLDT